MKKMYTQEQIAYLAGIIDGEGCINIYSRKSHREYRLRFNVVNTDARLIKWLRDTFGGSIFVRKTKANWKTKWEWTLAESGVEELLPQLLPYLIIKKEQAELAIDFRETFNKEHIDWDFRLGCFNQMRALNHREWLAAETKRESGFESRSDSPLLRDGKP